MSSSIKQNDKLEKIEIAELIKSLFNCESPFLSLDGKPCMINFEPKKYLMYDKQSPLSQILPPVVKNLLIINILLFIATGILQSPPLNIDLTKILDYIIGDPNYLVLGKLFLICSYRKHSPYFI